MAFGSAVKSSTIADIEATIVCERESHKGIIIGKQGAMLKRIGSKARPEIEDMLGCKVNLIGTVFSTIPVNFTNSCIRVVPHKYTFFRYVPFSLRFPEF